MLKPRALQTAGNRKMSFFMALKYGSVALLVSLFGMIMFMGPDRLLHDLLTDHGDDTYLFRELKKELKMKKDSGSELIVDDISDTPLGCGGIKCFYPSKSDKHTGYMVGPKQLYRNRFTDGLSEYRYFANSRRAYHFERCLMRKYEIEGIFIDRPEMLALSYNNSKKFDQGLGEGDNAIIVVQKNRMIGSHVELGCDFWIGGKHTLRDQLIELWLNAPNATEFIENLHSGLGKAKIIFRAYPCLLWDVQYLVDSSGKVFFHDLDRCPDHDFTKCNERFPESHYEDKSRWMGAGPAPFPVLSTRCEKSMNRIVPALISVMDQDLNLIRWARDQGIKVD